MSKYCSILSLKSITNIWDTNAAATYQGNIFEFGILCEIIEEFVDCMNSQLIISCIFVIQAN